MPDAGQRDWAGRYEAGTKTEGSFERLDRLGLDWLCDQLIEGRSVRAIARKLDASAAGILRWLDRKPGRMRQYQLAREVQADVMIDELIELADSPVPTDSLGRTDSAAVQQLRRRVDTRKWIASKFRPDRYGDRVEVNANVSATDLRSDEIMTKILALLSVHGLRVVPGDEQTAGAGDSTLGAGAM